MPTPFPSRSAALLAGAPLLLALPTPAAAVPVTMSGNVLQSCILTVSTTGLLGVSTDGGRTLGSEETGGIASVLAIVATGGAPSITVGAPSMSSRPGAYTGTPTVSVRYSSLGGASQAYTSGSSGYTSSNPLGDTLTVNMKAVDNGGFAAGAYQLTTNVTCQQ